MKWIAVVAVGLIALWCATVAAFVANPGGSDTNPRISVSSALTAGSALAQPSQNANAADGLQLTFEPRDVAEPADKSSPGEGKMRGYSGDEPTSSSGPPVPMPPAGWIGLVGLLGVIVLRWFRLARRFWAAPPRY
ncbi:MAG TPA: hypothetical protein VHX86_08945 [Tepidisphaeraceae bacterium]|nr:hypothetical protein [Tepidisphaeraceae bacterium]